MLFFSLLFLEVFSLSLSVRAERPPPPLFPSLFLFLSLCV